MSPRERRPTTPRLPAPTDDDNRVTRVAALTLVNAMIFHEIVAQREKSITPLNRVLGSSNVAKALEKSWTSIVEDIDYVPIFELARQIIKELYGTPGLDDALRRLGDAALNVVSRRAALRHDLMGRIYHLLLRDAKYFGAYYTRVPTAALLLKLTLDPDVVDVDFADPAAVGDLRIADLACGTGTLLKAALQTVIDNHVRARAEKNEPIALADVHRRLIEDGLYGLDVIPFAIHLAASALAMHEPDALFGKMRLYTLPLSGKRKPPQLGSIEAVSGGKVHVQADLFGSPTGPQRTTGGGDVSEVVSVPKLDLCVMNPPFTRSVGGNLLFGNIPKVERAKMQAELRRIVRTKGLRAEITAGLGSVFVAIGEPLVKPGGHLALVLPRGVLSGVAWEPTRKLIGAYYTMRYIIVCHEPGKWSLSENTFISECLLIARRRSLSMPADELTKVVNLWVRPESAIEALALARLIRDAPGVPLEGATGSSEIMTEGRKLGEVILCPSERIKAGDWMREAAFAQTELSRAAQYLLSGKVYVPGVGLAGSVPVRALGKIAKAGPDRRDIHDGFAISHAKTAYAALWGHATDAAVTMALEPNKHLAPLAKAKPGRHLRDPHLLWSRAGGVVVAERLRLNLVRVAAARTSRPVLSNTWWPVKVDASSEVSVDQIEKILVLWLNSTLGVMSLIAARVETEGPWVEIKKPVLHALPVLDPIALNPAARDALCAVYDELAIETLQALPSIKDDAVRASIDVALLDALQLRTNLIPLREILSLDLLLRPTPKGASGAEEVTGYEDDIEEQDELTDEETATE
jgi:hypothetical protein